MGDVQHDQLKLGRLKKFYIPNNQHLTKQDNIVQISKGFEKAI